MTTKKDEGKVLADKQWTGALARKGKDPAAFIVYEKMTGRVVQMFASDLNDAALKAIRMLPARHNEVRKVEVINIDDMTTIKVKMHQPELLDE